MKTKIKVSALFLLAGLSFISSNIFSQCFQNVFGPPRTEVQSQYPLMDLTYNAGCPVGAGTALTGVGINQSNPQYLLDILDYPVANGRIFRTIGNSLYDCDWESWAQATGGSPIMYGRIYIPASTTDFAMSSSTYSSGAHLYGGNLQFLTPDGFGSTVLRMRIDGPRSNRHQQGQTYNRSGYVGVNVNPASMNMPVSMLTLDGDNVTDGDGFRPWMKVGTYMGNNTDNMYVGLLDNLDTSGAVIGNRTDAVIAWGNDSTTASNAGPDVLRFVFTNYDTTNASVVWGSEAGRWEPNGNFGVGDFRISQDAVHNRIEDYTWLPGTLTHNQWLSLQDSTGQLRLTYKPKVSGMLGTHADFQVDSIGDLLINPQNDSTPRFAGIGIRVLNAHTNAIQAPQNTLEIMSGWHSPHYGSSNGSSGLKFRNMNSSSIPVKNPGKGYLGLDNAGNVIYVDT